MDDVLNSNDDKQTISSIQIRRRKNDALNLDLNSTNGIDSPVSPMCCAKCQESFLTNEDIVSCKSEVWHKSCFVCVQCFRPFENDVFFEHGGRRYCDYDFRILFAPCCNTCDQFIIGKVIKAMDCSWHPECFKCALCSQLLVNGGFVKNLNRALCRECNFKEKCNGTGRFLCNKCHSIIEEGSHLKYKGEYYHPYHFHCVSCESEVNCDAREKDGELYCLRCYDKMGIPICAACRRPIEERVVHAMGKTWHVEHFVCNICEKPFLGSRHYEKNGQAYCETHYQRFHGQTCFLCNDVINDAAVVALNKAWCEHHFTCSVCDRVLNEKTKFFELDLKPVCRQCIENFPNELRRRLVKMHKTIHKSQSVSKP